MAPDLIRVSAGATERRARTVMVWPERGAGLSPLVAGCDHWISPMDFAGADMGSERRQSCCAALRAGLSQRRFLAILATSNLLPVRSLSPEELTSLLVIFREACLRAGLPGNLSPLLIAQSSVPSLSPARRDGAADLLSSARPGHGRHWASMTIGEAVIMT